MPMNLPQFGTVPESFAAMPQPQAPAPMPAAPAVAPPQPMPMAPQAPAFQSAPMTPPQKPGWSQMLTMLPALLAGIKNPVEVGAALAGWQRGQDKQRERMLSEQDKQATRAQAAARFYGDAITHAQQFDDEIALQQYLQAVQPMADYYGVSLSGLTISDEKKSKKDRGQVQEAIDRAVRLHGPEILNNDQASIQLAYGRTFSMPVARQMVGGTVTAGGKAVPVPDSTKTRIPAAPGSFEEFIGATPERRAEILKARGEYADSGRTDSKGSIEQQYADAERRGDMAEMARLKRAANIRDNPPVANPGTAEARVNARVDRIVSSFNGLPLVKEYNEVQAQRGIIREVVNGSWSGPGDMAAVFAFMKALDPSSVVRETEYDNAAKSGNIFTGWAARFNGALNPSGGFLSEQVRKDFLKTIESRFAIKTKQYDNLRKQLVERVDRIKAGAPETGDEALIDYASGADAPTAKPTGRFNPVTGKVEQVP